MKIYLAGGMQSGWQDQVMRAVEADGHQWLDPRKHGREDPREYTAWDLNAIEHCDWVFAYFEESNPSGFGLTLEIGYAKGLGKRVIFCDEKSETSPLHMKHLRIVEHASDVYFTYLDDAIEFLASLPYSYAHRLTNAV